MKKKAEKEFSVIINRKYYHYLRHVDMRFVSSNALYLLTNDNEGSRISHIIFYDGNI